VAGRRLALIAAVAVSALIVAGCGTVTPSIAGTPRPAALAAGTYTSRSFKPPVTFTVPAGWTNGADAESYFELRPAGSDVVGIYLFRGPLPASQDRACPDRAEPGVGTTSGALSTWISSLPGLTVSSPRLASVGGLRGVELDLQIAPGWTFSCPFANGLPSAPLFVGSSGDFRWVIAGSERLRLDLLDGPDGTTIVVDIDAFEGSLMEDFLAAASPIVRTFMFKAN